MAEEHGAKEEDVGLQEDVVDSAPKRARLSSPEVTEDLKSLEGTSANVAPTAHAPAAAAHKDDTAGAEQEEEAPLESGESGDETCALQRTAMQLDSYDRLFFISTDAKREKLQLRHTRLIEHLEAAGLRQATSPAGIKPLFVWAEMLESRAPNGNQIYFYSKELFHLQCGTKNILDPEKFAVCRKDQLYRNMRHHSTRCQKGKQFMADTSTFGDDPLPHTKPDDVFIIRPVDGHAGIGISVLKGPSERQLKDAAQHAQDEVSRRIKARGRSSVIITRYVTDPLLWNGTKFHLRVYLLASVLNGMFTTYCWDVGEFFTAGKPFVNAAYDDHLVHDTHAKTTTGDLEYPRDLPAGGITLEQAATIHNNVRSAMRCVSSILRKHARPYSESAAAFEVLGADVLVRADLSVVLMEINDKVGYGFHTEAHAVDFSARYFDWVNDCVIKPLVGLPGAAPLYCSKAVRA